MRDVEHVAFNVYRHGTVTDAELEALSAVTSTVTTGARSWFSGCAAASADETPRTLTCPAEPA